MQTDTTQEITQNNTLVYILVALVVALLGYIGYINVSYDMLKKHELENKYVLQSDVDFDMLPAHVKNQYVEFYEHNQQINNLNQKIRYLSQNTSLSQEPKIIEKIVEVEKIVKVPVEKIVEVEKIVNVPVEKIVEVEKMIAIPVTMKFDYKEENTLVNSKKFNTYTCKKMNEGSIKISKECIKKLHNFLDENKKAKRFEVIGMVDDKDFKLISTLKDVYGEKRIKNLAKYSQIGLSRQRVIEASWIIKEYIGDYKNIKTVNYTVHSKNKKGFVVRAYR